MSNMPRPNATPVTCPRCRQPFSAVIEQLIDVSRDPQAKVRLLSGRTNVITCPHCGAQTALATPLAYHDPDKQLLIVYVPMELGLPQKEQERVIGSFTNAISNSLPPERRRAYLLTPRMALTQQGMIESILEADGVTPAMLAAQREKMKLVETLLQTDPAQYPELVKQHDAEMDTEFFAIMLSAAESAAQNGRPDVAEQVLQLRDQLIQLSTVGQQALASAAEQQVKIDEVSAALNALGEQVTREKLLDAVIGFGDDAEKLEIAVSMARPAMDYPFLQLLSDRIDKATADEKVRLTHIRAHLLNFIGVVDQENEAVVRRATDTLRSILNSPDLDQAINDHIEAIDELFLQVLTYNLQAAEEAKDAAISSRLRAIYEKVVEAIQASAPPQVQFINQLLSAPAFEDVQAQIAQNAAQFGPDLLQWIDALSEDFGARQTADSAQIVDRLGRIRDEVERALAAVPQLMPQSQIPQSQMPQSPMPSQPLRAPTQAPEAEPADKPKFEILRGGKYTPIRPK